MTTADRRANFAAMAVQFLCPSCHHPIEIDDEWARQTVACPFCRNTVTAPANSTYSPVETVPAARGIEPARSGELPHAGSAEWTGGNVVAVWAFGLSCMWLLAWIVAESIIRPRMVDTFGPNPNQEDMYRFWTEHLQAGTIPRWLIAGLLAMVMSLALWVAALVCAILGVRARRRRGFAMAAFVVLSFFPIMLCAGLLLGR